MSDALLQPYLFFNGRCEEALAFYGEALGAQTEMLMRYSDNPEPPPPGMVPAGFENKVMHCSFRIGQSVIMASDGCEEGARFDGFSLSLSLTGQDEARRVFALLGEGGQVRMPLTKTFWSPCFGMLTDRFGIGWMISAA
ncbi:VOC family protein [Noviherbaspirillum pedocola]|uniref:VOC family protein n=1 Tax=Noviherbaspirillum pedocola TaxID=2801341 RepID=A0A934SUF8_9BURK|nr:VOC family protein [Noviherbaspirillum pedocola]MBK4735468.1 VOC family protein [Noviherbaspirillum pedocola]